MAKPDTAYTTPLCTFIKKEPVKFYSSLPLNLLMGIHLVAGHNAGHIASIDDNHHAGCSLERTGQILAKDPALLPTNDAAMAHKPMLYAYQGRLHLGSFG